MLRRGCLRKLGQRARYFHHRDCSAAVIVGAVIDPIARPVGAHAQMIVMRGQQNGSIAQGRIGTAQNSDHVAQRSGRAMRCGDTYGSGRVVRARLQGGKEARPPICR